MAVVTVVAVLSVSCDFKAIGAEHYGHGAVSNAGINGPAEQTLDFLGSGIGRYIPIFGLASEDRITHAASHSVGFIACAGENA